MMRSESTRAFGHPRLTKLTRGADISCRLSVLLEAGQLSQLAGLVITRTEGRNGATWIAGHRPCGVEGGRHRALAGLLSRHAGFCRDDAAPPRRRRALARLSADHRHAVPRTVSARRGRARAGSGRTAINHFCLECADLDATASALRAAGVTLTVEPKMGADHNRQCWIEDPDGNRIEFMQMGPNSMQVEAITRLRG